MAEYSWPSRSDATIIGKSPRRLDGMVKSTGAAKYSYDVNLDKQLYAVGLGCPSAHCKIKSIDTSGAEETPGVVHVHVFDHAKPDEEGELPEVQWQGELLVAVAAVTEAAAREGVSKIKLDLEELDVFTDVEDLEAAEAAGRARRAGERAVFEQEPGDDDNEDEFEEKELARLFKESKHIVEGYYGIDSITHCCLEPHGSTVVQRRQIDRALVDPERLWHRRPICRRSGNHSRRCQRSLRLHRRWFRQQVCRGLLGACRGTDFSSHWAAR